MIEAVVFDMDGILFDTERISVESWREIAGEMGIGNIEEGIYGCIGLNRTDCRIFLRKTYGETFPYELFHERTGARFREKVERDGLPVMKGARELLDYLKERGTKTALASSTSTAAIEAHLKRSGFTEYFMTVIGGDSVEHSKPQPDIYLKACERLNVPPENAVAIEDSPNGIKSAYAAGMKPVMVPDIVRPDRELRKLLYCQCDSLLEVRDMLRKEWENK